MGTLRSSVVALAVLVGAFIATVPAAAEEGNGPGAYRPYYPGIWQGLYGDVNLGWGCSGDASGVVGGGQIGYNWQSNQYLYGLEGDISAADIGISQIVPGAVLNSASIQPLRGVGGEVREISTKVDEGTGLSSVAKRDRGDQLTGLAAGGSSLSISSTNTAANSGSYC